MKRSSNGDPHPPVLTDAQCRCYAKNGYLILPDILASEEVSNLLDEARRVIADISSSGDGYPQYDAVGGEIGSPSPVGRLLVRYETGQSLTIRII